MGLFPAEVEQGDGLPSCSDPHYELMSFLWSSSWSVLAVLYFLWISLLKIALQAYEVLKYCLVFLSE